MKQKWIVVACAAAFGMGASSVASAQQDDDYNDVFFEEVVVTATKRELNIYEVPLAITAFTEATMFRQGITDLTDVGKFVPNMTVTGFSAGHTSSVNVFIRGIGVQDHLITTDPGVGVYVDGVYLGRQVGQNWSLANIERVEVLRGPQGTLYGRNSIGGAINIITRKPGSESGGRVTANAGTRGRFNGSFYWNAAFTDTFAASVTGSYNRRNGVGDFLTHDAPKDVGEMKEWSGRIAAKWDVTDNFSLLLAYDKNDNKGGLRPYTTLIDEVPTGLLYGAGARNSDLASNPYDSNGGFYIDENGNVISQSEIGNEAHGWALTADWEITQTLSARGIFSDRKSEYTAGLDDDSVEDVQFQYPEAGFADQKSAELQLIGEYDAWDFVSGLYYLKEKGANGQFPNFFLAGPGTFLLSQKAKSKAIYGNVGFQVNNRLRLSGGARYTKDKKKAGIDLNGLIVEANERDWNETSWELQATWDLNNNMNLYGTIQNGYQSGQYPPRPYCLFANLDFDQPGNVSRPNCFEATDNVTATNYEIGLKGQPTDTLSMAVALFYTKYSDLPYQISSNEGGGFNTVSLIVDQKSKGFEWESSWAPTDRFILHAAIGYIDADIKDADPTIVAPLTPKWTATISPEYTVPMSNGGGLQFRIDWSYRSSMFGQPFDDPTTFTKIDGRSLFNFDIAYISPDETWTLGVYGRNVADKKYDNARLLPDDYVLVILNNDRSEFGLRFNYTFGL
jgi:iron complex outermembrane receptor protein